MNESEANEMKQQIFAQLDDFDEYVEHSGFLLLSTCN